MYERRSGRLLKTPSSLLSVDECLYQLPPVLSSDRHVLLHVVSCRLSAQGNLQRDLDVAARRPAVLAPAQPFGS
eukprot:5670797-Pleurochrysis_carterae.AAC.1